MLRLRRSVFAGLLSSPATSPIPFPLYRLISAAAPAASPNPSFVVGDYLVATCGLTPAQALKASAKLSHLKSPTKPEAVLAFLAGLGISNADVAAAVAKDPQLLCAKVEKTLASNVAGLTGLGLSHTEIARLVSLVPHSFRCRSTISNLPYHLSLFGSYENLLRVLKYHRSLLSCNVEMILKPNVAFLRECGLSDCEIAKLGIVVPRMLTTDLERLRAMVALAEGLGVPHGSGMFRQALQAVAFLSEEKIAVKVAYLKNTFRWSDAEVSIAVSKAPVLLRKARESLQRTSEFLISEVGVEPAHLFHYPVMINYSLEGRLKPRYYALRFLKENGLLKRDLTSVTYYTVVKATEKVFMKHFIRPHKEATPHLAEDYQAACRGEVPIRFRFA